MSDRFGLWAVAGLVLVYCLGMLVPVMEIDAAQYASIAMEMLQNDQWLEVKHRGMDYLDKPPLLFWISAVSFSIFDLSAWAYKLPSLLMALLGVYGLYRFTKLFYTKQTARYASLILISCVGGILMGNDIRTDTLLLGTTICSIWQLAEYQQYKRWLNLLLAGLFIGLAMLAKGPVGAVVPACSIGLHLILTRQWRTFLDRKWLPMLSVTALVLLPMCWGLYHQFDLHPEKEVNGRTGTSGLYFYFWEQSFGRITGQNVWKNDASGFFFFHVLAWALLPWTFLFVAAFWQKIRELIRQKALLTAPQEGYSLGALVLPFIALSQSQYKLPHYIFVVLPWAAVILADWLAKQPLENRFSGIWKSSDLFSRLIWALHHIVVLQIIWLGSTALLVWAFPTVIGFALGGLSVLLWCLQWWRPVNWRQSGWHDSIQVSLIWSIALGILLNGHFYPDLLEYQGTMKAGLWAKSQPIPAEKITYYHTHGHALEFYYGKILTELFYPEDVQAFIQQHGETLLFTTEGGRATLTERGIQVETVASFWYYPVTQIKGRFLNPETRERTLEKRYWLKITRQ